MRQTEQFDRIYAETRDDLLRYLTLRTNADPEAEDLFQEVYRRFYDRLTRGVPVLDPRRYLFSVAKKLLGIVGNPEFKNVNEVSKDVKLDEVFTEAMRQEGVYTNEVAARTAVGRGHRPLRLYVSPMRREEQVVGALAIVEDITELRRLEQVRTDFAANVSHELKTPLTSIRGFVETLQAGAIDNPEMAHKFLNIIMMETERLTRLINDILSISKLESGDDEVAIERIRLELLIKAVDEKPQNTEFFIEGRLPERCALLGNSSLQDLRDPVECAVLAVQRVVGRKRRCDLRILQILHAEPLIDLDAHLFINFYDPGQVLPASRRHELPAVDLCFDTVEVFLADF